MTGITDAHRSERLVSTFALAAAVLVLIVIVSSAWLRLAHSGLGCADWPACYGAFREALDGTAAPQLGRVRTTHRLAAGAAGLAILMGGVLWLCGRRTVRGVTALVVALFVLTIALSVLGRFTPGSSLPAVALGNMIGGMLLFALAWTWYVALSYRLPSRVSCPPRAVAPVGLSLIVLQTLVGGLVSTQYAALACTTFPDCHGMWWPPIWSWQAFDPWQPLSVVGGDVVLRLRQALHIAHRYGALLAAAGAIMLTLVAFKCGGALRLHGMALIALVIVQCTLGVAMILVPPQLVLTVAHDVVAALTLAVAAAVTWCASTDRS